MLGVYVVVERKTKENPDRRNLWLSIGVAFVNRDGSINVRLNALPVDGVLHIRPMQNGQAAAEPDEPVS
jgi:hypothetical protein